jgi:hypothetical protein
MASQSISDSVNGSVVLELRQRHMDWIEKRRLANSAVRPGSKGRRSAGKAKRQVGTVAAIDA